MLKNIILFIIVVSLFYGAYKFYDKFTYTAQRKASESITVPRIGVIIKGAKGLQEQSEENVRKHESEDYFE